MRSRLSKRVGILVVVIASLLVGTSVLAQSPFAPAENPIEAVLAKLDQIIETLAPDTPAPGPVTLLTGIVGKHLTEDVANCNFINVSTATIPNVRVTMFSETGEVLEEGTFDAPPGHFHSESQRTGQFARCQFSFVGFADDVRATLVINEGPNFSGFRTLAALDAR